MEWLSVLMLGVALIPTGSTQCDTDDYACKDAVARSEKAKQWCQNNWSDICRQDPSQLEKRFPEHIRVPAPGSFNWTQDNPKRGHCVTTIRTVRFQRDCGRSCFVVSCPGILDQWTQQVDCKVGKKKKKLLGVKKGSKNGCPSDCREEWVLRRYLVTNVAPRGFMGHCFDNWLPVWYKMVNVPSHCECPR